MAYGRRMYWTDLGKKLKKAKESKKPKKNSGRG